MLPVCFPKVDTHGCPGQWPASDARCQGLSLFSISTSPLRQLFPRSPRRCFCQAVCLSPCSLSSALGPLPTQHHIPRGTFFTLQIPCTSPCIAEGLGLSCSPLSSKTSFPPAFQIFTPGHPSAMIQTPCMNGK